MKKWIIAIAALAALTGCASRFDTPSVLSALLMTDSSGASIRSLRLEVGETVSLKALTRPENADVSIKWSSSNPSVASVTQDGLVTGLGLGITRILAVSGSYRASCTVTIGGMPAYDIAAAFSAPAGVCRSDYPAFSIFQQNRRTICRPQSQNNLRAIGH